MKIPAEPLVIVRVVIGALFVFSGFQKLMQPSENLLAVIHTYALLPNAAAVPFSKILPWAEYIAGVFLILGLWTRLSLAILWLSNTAFIAALSQALPRKLPLGACGCFGDAVTLSPKKMLIVDILLWGVFFILWSRAVRAKPASLDGVFDHK